MHASERRTLLPATTLTSETMPGTTAPRHTADDLPDEFAATTKGGGPYAGRGASALLHAGLMLPCCAV